MEKIIFERPNEVYDALSKGKKLVIFEVDDGKNAILPISEVYVKNEVNLPKNSEIIRAAIKYANEHYNKQLRLDVLADMCDLSKSYFCRLFKESVGMGATEYLIELRIEEACRLLIKTDLSVVAIAVEVGYVDCGYFNRLFKKKVGCTPLEYRNRPREAELRD